MKKTNSHKNALRMSAEALLAHRTPETANPKHLGEKLLHELQVYQIELEMQNEALRQSQMELERSRDRYMDFYDFSPVGYITLDDQGMIAEINLTGATMLGITRNRLHHQRFAAYLASDCHDNWYRHFRHAITHDEPLTCELPLQRKDGSRTFVRMDCLRLSKPGETPVLRIVLTDISERIKGDEAIRRLAFYDALTQLPNRRLLDDRLDQAMAASKRSGKYAALMFLDLDDFKPLNDQYGHSTGDLLLVEVARRVSACIREMDTVARFGGDEFVILLSELDTGLSVSTTEASIVADKIRSVLAEPYLLTIRTQGKAEITATHHCTSSIGVILFINHETSREDILRCADMAMYQAKDDGRNRIRFFNPARVSDMIENKRLTAI